MRCRTTKPRLTWRGRISSSFLSRLHASRMCRRATSSASTGRRFQTLGCIYIQAYISQQAGRDYIHRCIQTLTQSMYVCMYACMQMCTQHTHTHTHTSSYVLIVRRPACSATSSASASTIHTHKFYMCVCMRVTSERERERRERREGEREERERLHVCVCVWIYSRWGRRHRQRTFAHRLSAPPDA